MDTNTQPKKPKTRGPKTVLAITYPLIAELIGQSIWTARRKYKNTPASLDTIVSQINAYRVRKGWKAIGCPKGMTYAPDPHENPPEPS